MAALCVPSVTSNVPAVPAALLRLALDHIPEGLVVVDDHGSLVYVNATWSRMASLLSSRSAGWIADEIRIARWSAINCDR